MKDQRTSCGAEDKYSSVQQICVLDVNHQTIEKNWTHTPSTSGSYGRLAKKMYVEVDSFKIPYRL